MITQGRERRTQIVKVISLFLFLLFPSWLLAVELSDVRIYSLLNEPLNAEITLSKIKGTALEEILVSVADREQYGQAGLDPLDWIYFIKFNVIKNPDTGKTVIKMTTEDPVKDPYIDLMLVATSPVGKVVREYTLLLDPPKVALSSSPLPSPKTWLVTKAAKKQETSTETETVVVVAEASGKVASRVKQRSEGRRLERAHSRVVRPGGHYGPIFDETLWSIAKRLVENTPFSVYQGVAAIADKNPGAFRYGNINCFSEGTVLELPSVDELASISRIEAQHFVEAQNEDWQQSSVRVSAPAPAPAPKEQRTRKPLRLVAPEPETSLETVKSSKRISMIEEQMDTLKRSNEDFNQKNEYLKSQNDALAASLSSKDLEIQNLKEAMQKGQTLPTEEFAIAKPDVPRPDGVPAFPEPTPITPPDIKPEIKPEIPVAKPDVVAPVTSPTEVKVESVASPTEEPTYKKRTDIIRDTIIGLIGLFTLLLMISIGFWKGREPFFAMLAKLNIKPPRSKESVEPYEPTVLSGTKDHLHFDLEKALTALNQEEKRYLNFQTKEATTKDKEEVTLEDVDVYIAYERYAQAEKILQSILLKQPNHWEALLKLLELYVLTEDYKDFEEWYKTVPPDLNELAPRVWSRIELLKNKVQNEKSVQIGTDQPAASTTKQDFDLNKKYSLSLEETELPKKFSDSGSESDLHNLLPEVTDEPEELKEKAKPTAAKPPTSTEAPDEDIQSQIALAKAYIDIGDYASAREYLMKALEGGTAQQKQQVQTLLDRINKEE